MIYPNFSAAHGAVILPNSCIGETVEYELCSVHVSIQ